MANEIQSNADSEWHIGPKLARWRRFGAVASWVGVTAIAGWLISRIIKEAADTDGGDFRHFYWAAEAMRQGRDVYDSGTFGYIYPPFFAWSIQPLVSFGRVGAEQAWGGINLLLLALSMVLAFRIVAERLKGPRDAITWSFILLAGALLSIDQIRQEFKQGQTDTIVLASFTLALYLLGRFPLVAGMVLGFAAQVKHQAVLPVLYLLVRGRVKPMFGFVVAMPLIATLPMTTMGKDSWWDAMQRSYGYVGSVSAVAETNAETALHPITWEKSVSIPSAIARAIETDEGVPTALLMALVGLTAAFVFGITWLIYKRFGEPMFAGRWGPVEEKSKPGVVLIEWAGLFIALLAFSPQAMNRHGFILVFVHVLIAYLVFVPKSGINRWPLIIGALAYQIAQIIPAEDKGMLTESFGWWMRAGGESWCMLLMWFGLVWTGLDAVRKGYPKFVNEKAELSS
ncbi:MAG: hypothetical protein Phyf2KO_08610 [Phycisphaerales bacterium]